MASHEFRTDSPQTIKRWSPFMSREAIGRTSLRPLMGTSVDSVIQVHRDLRRQRGDRVKIDLLMQLAGYGVHGRNTLRGKEKVLTFHQMELGIDQLREGVDYDTMSQQRTLHNLRRLALQNLADFYARVFDEVMFAHLAGTAGGNTELSSEMDGFGGNSFTAPDADHLVDKTGVGTMSLDFIPILKEKAKTLDPLIRPVMVNGEPKYILILHPHQVTSLKNEAGSSKWREITALARERSARNPIYTGSLGEFDGVILRESEYVPIGDTGTNDCHAPFLGAQAGHMAFGNPYRQLNRRPRSQQELFSVFEDEGDYGDKTGIAVGSIWGIAGAVFNSAFFGRLVLRTDDPAHS